MASEKVTRKEWPYLIFCRWGIFFSFAYLDFALGGGHFGHASVVPLTGSGTGAPFRRDVRRLNFFFCLVAVESEKEEAREATKKTKQAAATTTVKKKEKKWQSLEIFNTWRALPLERLNSEK